MRRAIMVAKEVEQIGTIEDLTSVFESIASMKIARIKNQVAVSSRFFHELWQIYTQLRVDEEHYKPREERKMIEKHAFVVVTSEGGLSGDIDQRIVDHMLKSYDPSSTDIIVVGGHGATILAQRRVPITRYFRLAELDDPNSDKQAEVAPIAQMLSGYRSASAFYQTYVSLADQQPSRIDLISAVQALSAEAKVEEVISSRDYVFEPSLGEIVAYMESVMMGVALGQVMLESKLAQYASRFNAMSAAKKKAKELDGDLNNEYHRAKRSQADERLREVITAMDSLE